ncbi:peptidoglycan DD-metalloendopeptidase family protein [Zooshikella sp. RANM57]|uniref:peptidoglycan DD-metalloendopeptidase family protein n=1 Tax=Zooshikella sp. RANM57 TaxID=3425863 RepID=UPI003D6ED7E0
MNIIVVRRSHGQSKTVNVRFSTILVASILFLASLVVLSAWITYCVMQMGSQVVVTAKTAKQWQHQIALQKQEIEHLKKQANVQLDSLALRVSELQSRIVRLDALGERLTSMAQLNDGEFDFSEPPAVGGPSSQDLDQSYTAPDFIELMDQLIGKIESRETQLEILEDLLANRKLSEEFLVKGVPVLKGFISSRFGYRTDPITGRRSFHGGIDFAAKHGENVLVVASGVVTFSGRKNGYGNVVEVNHGAGLVTLYAHNSALLVDVGDIVEKGQSIALVGSTGRSTGPHVHFEVFKGGRRVNPSGYIDRNMLTRK